VERVEVVKGPLSALYGSDAIGGVVNLITREPASGFRMDARTLAGGEGRMEAQTTVSGGDGALRYRITGAWRQFDGVPGLAADQDAFSRVWDARSTLRWELGDGLRLRTDASVVRERQRWPVGAGFNGFNDNLGITAWTELEAEATGGVWTVRAFGQDYDHLFRSARGDAPIAGADEEEQQERLWKGALEYGTWIGSTRIDVGAEAARREIRSPDKILEDRASDSQLELFGQGAVELGTAIVSPGARWTLNDRWGNTVSPSLGVSWLAAEVVHLKASVGRGFRAPSFKELAWDFTNLGGGYAVRGFSELEPERSWNVSAGVGWAPLTGLRLGLEAYHNEIDGLIQFSFEGSTRDGLLIFSPRNVAEARTRGFEASAAYRRGAWRTALEYAFLDARSLEDDLPLNRRARHSGLARVGWSTGWLQGLTLDLTGRWTGEAPLVGTGPDGDPARLGTQEELVALDGQAVAELGRGLRLRLGGDNLLDRRPAGYSIAVGRRLRVGLEARDLF
jgi:outer membrane receptor for ferrienterochelin and colicins